MLRTTFLSQLRPSPKNPSRKSSSPSMKSSRLQQAHKKSIQSKRSRPKLHPFTRHFESDFEEKGCWMGCHFTTSTPQAPAVFIALTFERWPKSSFSCLLAYCASAWCSRAVASHVFSVCDLACLVSYGEHASRGMRRYDWSICGFWRTNYIIYRPCVNHLLGRLVKKCIC